MRVLVFTMVFPNAGQPLHGTFVLERIRRLAARADIQVIAPIPWFRAWHASRSTIDAEPIIAIRYPRFWYIPKNLKYFRGLFLFLSTVRQITQLRREFDFDLIDAHFAYPDGFAAVLLGLWFSRPVCVTLRGTIAQWSRRPIGRWLCDWTMRRAARVIAVAENLAQRARQGHVPESRIATIPNGIDTARFRLISRVEARRGLGVGEGQIIVSVGHISPRKGFHHVIKSLATVRRSHADVRLIIVGGKGAEEDNSAALHALVQQLSLSEHVLFVGPKNPDEVAVWLAAANVFVLASHFEGCPNVVLEAMACGRPVVASKVGDIERMVPGFAGVLFDDPEDHLKLAECLNTALDRDWDPQRIRSHVASRSWDEVAVQVLAQWRLAVTSFGRDTTSPDTISLESPV